MHAPRARAAGVWARTLFCEGARLQVTRSLGTESGGNPLTSVTKAGCKSHWTPAHD